MQIARSFHVYLTIGAFCVFITSVLWEALWWQEFVAYSFFGHPPQVFIYGSLFLLTVSGLILENVDKKKRIFLLLAALFYMFVVALRVYIESQFGIPGRDSVCVYWCPHILLILAALCLLAFAVWSLLDHEESALRSIIFGAIFLIILHTLNPLRPTGIFAILGSWGAGIIVFVITFSYLTISRSVQRNYSATIAATASVVVDVSTFFLGYVTLYAHNLDSHVATSMFFGPYRHPAQWIVCTGLFCSAFLADTLRNKKSLLAAVYIACIYSMIVYVFGRFTLPLGDRYTTTSMALAVFSSMLGGVFAAVLLQFQRTHAA